MQINLMIEKNVALRFFTLFMVLKIEGGKGPLLRSRYYYLKYFVTLKIKTNKFDNLERKPHKMKFIRVVKYFRPQPNLETSHPFKFLHTCRPISGIVNLNRKSVTVSHIWLPC